MAKMRKHRARKVKANGGRDNKLGYTSRGRNAGNLRKKEKADFDESDTTPTRINRQLDEDYSDDGMSESESGL